VWKLQGTVLVTAVVPVVFAVYVAHDQARRPLERFISHQQGEWLDRNLSQLGARTESSDTVRSWELVELATGQVLGGDPDLLSAWLVHPSGADDLVAARVLVSVLPSGGPQRAAATATSAAIVRRRSHDAA